MLRLLELGATGHHVPGPATAVQQPTDYTCESFRFEFTFDRAKQQQATIAGDAPGFFVTMGGLASLLTKQSELPSVATDHQGPATLPSTWSRTRLS